MIEFSSVELKIETVGGPQAYKTLDDLNATGKKVMKEFAEITGQTLSEATLKYQQLGNSIDNALLKASARTVQLTDSTRALGLAQIKAIEMNEAMSASQVKAGAAAGVHGLQLGRLRMELGTLLGRLTGTNTALDRMGAAIGSTAIGDVAVIGALAGLAAIAFAYKKLTEDATNAAESMKKVGEEFSRIAHLDVKGQGEALAVLNNGDPFDKNLVGRFSIKNLEAQKADFARRAKGTIGTDLSEGGSSVVSNDAKVAAKALKEVNAELERRRLLIMSITTNSFPAAAAEQVRTDQPGFATDAIQAAEKASKARAQAIAKAIHQAEAAAKQLHRLNVANAKVDLALELEGGLKHNKAAADKGTEIQKSLASMQGSLKFNFDAATYVDPIQKKLDDAFKALAQHTRETLGRLLGEGLAAGFETAFSGGGLGNAFKSLTSSLLAGLGSMMEALGAQMIVFGSWVAKFLAHVATFDPIGQIEAGVGMIAAGAALKALAGSFGGRAGGGGSAGGYGSGGGFASIIDRGIINPGSYSGATKAPTAMPSVANYNTFYGVNDPQAVRWFDEIQRRSIQRGSLAGAV